MTAHVSMTPQILGLSSYEMLFRQLFLTNDFVLNKKVSGLRLQILAQFNTAVPACSQERQEMITKFLFSPSLEATGQGTHSEILDSYQSA